ALVHADGRQREERAAQPQDAEAEEQRQRADADASREQARGKRPAVRVHQPDADVAAETEEHDAAEIDVAGIAEHQIEIAGERDVNAGERQALAHFHVVSDRGRERESGNDERDDPEEWTAQHQPAPRRKPRMRPRNDGRDVKTPPGKAISTKTNSTNSMTSVQLTGTKGVTSPSRRPSATPPMSAPTGLPKPPRTVTTKLLS